MNGRVNDGLGECDAEEPEHVVERANEKCSTCGTTRKSFSGGCPVCLLRLALEFDANADENRIGTGVIVGGSLLSAVAAGLRIRNVNDLSIGSEEPNLGDVRTCLGRREVMDVRFECRLS